MNETKTFEVASENLGTVQVLHRDCPLCSRDNSDQANLQYSYDVWSMKTCPDCRMVYIDKGLDYTKLFSDLSWERTTKIEEKRRADLRTVSYPASKLTRIRMRLLPRKTIPALLQSWAQPGNVVDLGCGDGGQMVKLPFEFVPFGVEISTESAALADERFADRGGSCINAPTKEGLQNFADNFFSAATLRSYLEHEIHPLDVLIELHRVLRPEGVAILKVPNYGSLNRIVMKDKWCGFRYPDHLNYFTPKTLRAMGQKAGFHCPLRTDVYVTDIG